MRGRHGDQNSFKLWQQVWEAVCSHRFESVHRDWVWKLNPGIYFQSGVKSQGFPNLTKELVSTNWGPSV